MQLKPEDLSNNDYVLLDSLNHQELIPFVRLYLNKGTFFSRLYLVCNIMIFLSILWFIWISYQSSDFDFGTLMTYFSYGLALSFLLVPLHEFIHVLAYKTQGARETSYDANLKKFYFMAIADQFVTSEREFQVVALAPFILISTFLVIGIFLVSDHWISTILGTLMAHTAMCGGDFGLLSYFDYHRDKEIVTYDDKNLGESFFYHKINIH